METFPLSPRIQKKLTALWRARVCVSARGDSANKATLPLQSKGTPPPLFCSARWEWDLRGRKAFPSQKSTIVWRRERERETALEGTWLSSFMPGGDRSSWEWQHCYGSLPRDSRRAAHAGAQLQHRSRFVGWFNAGRRDERERERAFAFFHTSLRTDSSCAPWESERASDPFYFLAWEKLSELERGKRKKSDSFFPVVILIYLFPECLTEGFISRIGVASELGRDWSSRLSS